MYTYPNAENVKNGLQVKPKPAPNEIDIGGPAVALNCNDLEKS